MLVISDSSPLIALNRINKLDLLEQLYKEITVPSAVVKEITFLSRKKILLNKSPWIKIKSLNQPLSAKMLSANLGPGESQTIALALELKADLVILDELAARSAAEMLNLKITGTLGILLKAKQRHLILSVKELLDDLIRNEFRLSIGLYTTVLELASE